MVNADLMHRLLVDGVVDYAIYMLTPDGIVANWNTGAQRAKGYSASEIVGKHYSKFFQQKDIDAGVPLKNLQIARELGRFEEEGIRVRKDGSTFWAHVVIDAIRGANNELLGFAKITRDCTEQRIALEKQREQERRFRYLVQSVTDYAIYMLDINGYVTNWNVGAERLKGYKEVEVLGKHFSMFYLDEDIEAGRPAHALQTAKETSHFEAEGLRRRKDGSVFLTRVVIDAIYDDSGALIGFAKVTQDITERKEQERKLVESKELAEHYSRKMAGLSRFLDSVIAHIPASILVQDPVSKRILLANDNAKRLFRYSDADIVGAMVDDELFKKSASYILDALGSATTNISVPGPQRVIETAIGERVLRSRAVVGRNSDRADDFVLLITEDVTAEHEAFAKIRHMAEHDALTNLPNRTYFKNRLESSLRADEKRRTTTAVLCLDLDRFKEVNDGFGHAQGDKLLLAVAKRLSNELSDTSTLGRLGGDEFAIVLPDLIDIAEAESISRRLIDTISEPFLIDEHSFSIGLSVGIVSSNATTDAAELLRFADLALYEAKRNGRNRYEVFRIELEAAARVRRQMEGDLRKALHLGELVMKYQPIVDKRGPKISGFEALMRWNHPVKGEIAPLDFIPLAEETGLIHEIGARALNLACQEAAGWKNNETVAVNLSPVQFKNPGLVQVVALALADSGLRPERLELEITESVLLDESDTNIEILRDLKRLGVGISLDDFGTGYSSLSYLRTFPFDRIKIDKSFIRDMGDSREAIAIIRAITGLGNSLLIKTTAEGVETNEQFVRLQREGCSHFQGYYFGRPQLIPCSHLIQPVLQRSDADG